MNYSKRLVLFVCLLFVSLFLFADDVEDYLKRWAKSSNSVYSFSDENGLHSSLLLNPANLAEKKLLINLASVNASKHGFSSFLINNSDVLSKIINGKVSKSELIDMAWNEAQAVKGIVPYLDAGVTAGFQIGNFALGADLLFNLDFMNSGLQSKISVIPSIDSLVSVGYGRNIIKTEIASVNAGVNVRLDYRILANNIPISSDDPNVISVIAIYNEYTKYAKASKTDAVINTLKYCSDSIPLYSNVRLLGDFGFSLDFFDKYFVFDYAFKDFQFWSNGIVKYKSLNDWLSNWNNNNYNADSDLSKQLSDLVPDNFRIQTNMTVKPLCKFINSKYFDISVNFGLTNQFEFINGFIGRTGVNYCTYGISMKILDSIEVNAQKCEGFNFYGMSFDLFGNRIDLNYKWSFEEYSIDALYDDTLTLKVTLGLDI